MRSQVQVLHRPPGWQGPSQLHLRDLATLVYLWGMNLRPQGGCGGTRVPPGGKGGSERGSNRRPSSKTSARAIRGNSPPEEGGATLATSEGPICYRQMGVAPTDGRRFKSCTAHQGGGGPRSWCFKAFFTLR